jgi:hypothetical protein
LLALGGRVIGDGAKTPLPVLLLNVVEVVADGSAVGKLGRLNIGVVDTTALDPCYNISSISPPWQ